MKLTKPTDVRALLRELGFRPSKTLGQNFLIDENIVQLILHLARIEPDDVVLEIGPGLGVLTEQALQRASRVIAVEKDGRLHQFLADRHAGNPRLELLHADVMDLDMDALLARGVTKVISNLPYSVGSRILVNLLNARTPPRYILVTVQREVAARLRAKPSTKDYGLLSVWAQAQYDVVLDKVISPTCFLPPPQVQSAIVELFLRSEPLVSQREIAQFREITKAAFSQRRKQLGGFLEHQLNVPERTLTDLSINPRIRPEDLSVPDWARLCRAITAR